MTPIGAYWEPNINDRIRIVLQYDKLVRPLFWFQVRRDGSIYFSVRRKNLPVLKKGSKALQDDGRVTVNYSEEEIVNNIESRKNPRVSYHASGEVHLGETAFGGKSVNSIDKTERIAFVLFEHITKFSLTKKERKDIPISFKFDENKPLVGHLFVLPSNTTSEWMKPIVIQGVVSQFNLIFGYRGLDSCQDFALHLILSTVDGGPWPPYNYIVMLQQKDRHTDGSIFKPKGS